VARDVDDVLHDIALLDGILAEQRQRLKQLEGDLPPDFANSLEVYEGFMQGLVDEQTTLTTPSPDLES
jgi:hypothetical protein